MVLNVENETDRQQQEGNSEFEFSLNFDPKRFPVVLLNERNWPMKQDGSLLVWQSASFTVLCSLKAN